MKGIMRIIWKALAIGACIGLAQVSSTAFADGTETLGPPSIDISSGSGIVAAGTGLFTTPATISIDVPGTVNQALLYWEIADSSGALTTSNITVNGTDVTGTNIGGAVPFENGTINQYTFRADITGLVSPGPNSLILTAPGGDVRSDGASVLVIYDDGSEAVVDIRDGHDYVYALSGEGPSYQVSDPQTFTFDAALVDRTATFALIGGLGEAVRGDITRITVNGTTTDFSDEFRGQDGEQQSTVIIPVNVPAGDTSVTVEIISTNPDPDSIAWAAAGLSVRPPPEPGIDIEKLTNGNQADGANDGDVPQIAPGDDVTWRYEVTNTGNLTFGESEVVVTDDQGVTPVLDLNSDVNSDLELSPGETWIYTAMAQAADLSQATGTVPGCGDDRPTYENMGMVAVERFDLTDDDPSHYCNPGEPDIDIRKQAEGPDSRTFPSGSDVPFEIVVTNTGTVDLVNVVVTDVLAPDCDRNIGDLAVLQSVSYTCTAPDVTQGFTNEACVDGEDGDGTPVNDCDPSTVVIPQGGEGCTPGYWKQSQHFDSWVTYDPSDDYETVFGVDASFDETLLGALKQGGGGEKALGRHAVAALLNTSNPDVSYAFSTAQVIAIVQNAYATGNFNGAKNMLEFENEQGCPLN